MHPSFIILLVAALYLAGFTGLTLMRRDRPSLRFLVEGGVLSATGAAAAAIGRPLSPILFLVILYLLTMRVRLLVDLANLFSGRGRFAGALWLFRLALLLGPDRTGRQVVLINRGVTELRMKEPEAAFFTLQRVLLEEENLVGGRYQAAGFYNLGVACLRTGRREEALRHFRQAMALLPGSVYAHAAEKALAREAGDPRGSAEDI